MVRMTRVSTAPATALSIQINGADAGVLEAYEATAAGADGPTFVATVSDETAAKLQADAGLARHFKFEPVKAEKAEKPAKKKDGE